MYEKSEQSIIKLTQIFGLEMKKISQNRYQHNKEKRTENSDVNIKISLKNEMCQKIIEVCEKII